MFQYVASILHFRFETGKIPHLGREALRSSPVPVFAGRQGEDGGSSARRPVPVVAGRPTAALHCCIHRQPRSSLFLLGSFSAGSTPIFSFKYAFFSIFRDQILQEHHLLASKFCFFFKNFEFFAKFCKICRICSRRPSGSAFRKVSAYFCMKIITLKISFCTKSEISSFLRSMMVG